MTQQNLDFEELKNQYCLLNEKLEKQRIINEEMIQESMKEKLSYIEKWYKKQFLVCTIACPIISTIFMIQYNATVFTSRFLTHPFTPTHKQPTYKKATGNHPTVPPGCFHGSIRYSSHPGIRSCVKQLTFPSS